MVYYTSVMQLKNRLIDNDILPLKFKTCYIKIKKIKS